MKQRELPSDPMEDSERLMEELLPMAKLLLEPLSPPEGGCGGAEGL